MHAVGDDPEITLVVDGEGRGPLETHVVLRDEFPRGEVFGGVPAVDGALRQRAGEETARGVDGHGLRGRRALAVVLGQVRQAAAVVGVGQRGHGQREEVLAVEGRVVEATFRATRRVSRRQSQAEDVEAQFCPALLHLHEHVLPAHAGRVGHLPGATVAAVQHDDARVGGAGVADVRHVVVAHHHVGQQRIRGDDVVGQLEGAERAASLGVELNHLVTAGRKGYNNKKRELLP